MKLYLEQYGSYDSIRQLGRLNKTDGTTLLPPLNEAKHRQWKEWCFVNWHKPIFVCDSDPTEKARKSLKAEYIQWRRVNRPTRFDKLISFFKKTK